MNAIRRMHPASLVKIANGAFYPSEVVGDEGHPFVLFIDFDDCFDSTESFRIPAGSALSGYGKCPQMLWDSIRSCPHARCFGTGIFTMIRTTIIQLNGKAKPEMGNFRNNRRKFK